MRAAGRLIDLDFRALNVITPTPGTIQDRSRFGQEWTVSGPVPNGKGSRTRRWRGYFDGSDDLILIGAADDPLSGMVLESFTFTMLTTNTGLGAGTSDTLMNKGRDTSRGVVIYHSNTLSRIYAVIRDAAGAGNSQYAVIPNFDDGHVHAITVVYCGGAILNVLFYMDGINYTSSGFPTATVAYMSHIDAFILGRWRTAAHYLQGNMERVILEAFPRSPAQIVDLHRELLGGTL